MAGVIELNADNFEAEVKKAKGVVMVDFFAEWCGGCQKIAPVVEELAGDYEGRAKICKVDCSKNEDLAQEFGIMSIPNLIFFKDGEVKDNVVGAVPKGELAAKLDALL